MLLPPINGLLAPPLLNLHIIFLVDGICLVVRCVTKCLGVHTSSDMRMVF